MSNLLSSFPVEFWDLNVRLRMHTQKYTDKSNPLQAVWARDLRLQPGGPRCGREKGGHEDVSVQMTQLHPVLSQFPLVRGSEACAPACARRKLTHRAVCLLTRCSGPWTGYVMGRSGPLIALTQESPNPSFVKSCLIPQQPGCAQAAASHRWGRRGPREPPAGGRGGPAPSPGPPPVLRGVWAAASGREELAVPQPCGRLTLQAAPRAARKEAGRNSEHLCYVQKQEECR